MKNCKKCNVNITDDTNVCPLCKTILHSDKDNVSTGYSSYPHIMMSLDKFNLANKILLLISIISAVGCIVLNVFFPEILWSVICILGIIYLWITISYSIKKNVNIASKILIHTIAAILLAFIFNYVLFKEHWPILDYAIPIILSISNIALIILQIIQNIHHENYFVYQLVISVFSIIPLILLKLNMIEITLPTYIFFIIAGIALISTIIFYSKDFIAEIKKRFHF